MVNNIVAPLAVPNESAIIPQHFWNLRDRELVDAVMIKGQAVLETVKFVSDAERRWRVTDCVIPSGIVARLVAGIVRAGRTCVA